MDCEELGWGISYRIALNWATVNAAFNPLDTELNSVCHLLALWGTHHILHVSRLRVKRCSLQEAEHFLASWETASYARTHLLTGIDLTWQTIAVYKCMMNALEDSVPDSHYISRSSINCLHRLSDSVYGIWSATLTLQVTYDPLQYN